MLLNVAIASCRCPATSSRSCCRRDDIKSYNYILTRPHYVLAWVSIVMCCLFVLPLLLCSAALPATTISLSPFNYIQIGYMLGMMLCMLIYSLANKYQRQAAAFEADIYQKLILKLFGKFAPKSMLQFFWWTCSNENLFLNVAVRKLLSELTMQLWIKLSNPKFH